VLILSVPLILYCEKTRANTSDESLQTGVSLSKSVSHVDCTTCVFCATLTSDDSNDRSNTLDSWRTNDWSMTREKHRSLCRIVWLTSVARSEALSWR